MKKLTLITGASSGLGKDFALLAAQDGHDLVLTARREDLLNKLAAELNQKFKIKVHVVAHDLGKPGAGTALFEKTKALGLHVDHLINNAGFGVQGAFEKLTLPKQLEMMDLNMRAVIELTYLFLPAMREKNYGKILNVGSTAGFQPGPNFGVYYATKAFLNSWSQATAHELKGTGVSMTLLCPGPTETEFADVAGMKESRAFKTGAMKSFPVSAQGYKAMINGESITISGTFNKLMLQSQRLVPRSLVLNIASKLNREA